MCSLACFQSVCVCVCVCERESDIFTVILLKRSISFSFITVPMSSMAFRTICHDNNNHSSPCQRLQVPRFSPPSLTPSKSYTDTCKRSSIYSFSLWKCCYLKFFFFLIKSWTRNPSCSPVGYKLCSLCSHENRLQYLLLALGVSWLFSQICPRS